ncbi:histidine kinase [Actinotalea sp. K2]|uniref:histidine kinase n=1 Tax=Actinotalea sp. K2 TaxID=2939438 RepID=UPI00201768CB|nr:histidine kinase [Actinotalea sp. K2]MCL3863118.1 histidine kinase [Actinotalea sp. K2]
MSAPDPDPRPLPPDVPSESELERDATPATVRRAPRFRAFVSTGVILGAVAATLLVILHPSDGPLGRGTTLTFLALAFCLAGALLGGLVAVLVDQRSRRR